MAIARPIRVLGLAAIGLWIFFLYQVFGKNRINATLLSLVRNEEVEGMVQAMRDLERTWNSKFNYPWTFFNDVPFSEEFKRRTRKETKADVRYGILQISR